MPPQRVILVLVIPTGNGPYNGRLKPVVARRAHMCLGVGAVSTLLGGATQGRPKLGGLGPDFESRGPRESRIDRGGNACNDSSWNPHLARAT